MCSDECLGENPKSFPIQRAALEEDQLRWADGFSSHASLLLLPRNSLVRVLRATLLAVCTWDGKLLSLIGCLV